MIRWTENNRNIQGQFLPAAYTDIFTPTNDWSMTKGRYRSDGHLRKKSSITS